MERLVQTKCEARPRTRCVVAAGEVADAGALDLDDARAEVGELARRERRGDRVFERDDGECLRAVACAAPSAQRRDGVHRQPAFVVLGPQLDGLAVGLRLAVDAERVAGRRSGARP